MLFIIVISLISIKVVFEDAADIIFFKILIFFILYKFFYIFILFWYVDIKNNF